MFSSRRNVIACTTLLMVVLAIAIRGVAPCAATSEIPEKAKILMFLENVVGIDMEAYEILSFQGASDEKITPGHVETMLDFTLAGNSGDQIDVLALFIDGTFTWCTFYVEGTPVLKASYAGDLLNATRGFLRRYSVHFNASYCDKLTPLLGKIDALDRDQLVVTEHASLHVKVKEKGVGFNWICRVNGIDAPRKAVGFSFENGFLRSFIDKWDVTTIGSTTVNVSKKEAINIALNTAEEYIEDIGAKVTKITAKLDFYNDGHAGRGDRYTLYPRWSVGLIFDKRYGTVTGYHVSMWADTGEVFHADPQGTYGSTAPQGQLFDPIILIVILLLPAALATTAIIYRKRFSRPLKPRL